MKTSLVRILGRAEAGRPFAFLGTGFFVTPFHIITCEHVARATERQWSAPATLAILPYSPGPITFLSAHSKAQPAHLLSTHAGEDVALLHTPRGLPQGQKPAILLDELTRELWNLMDPSQLRFPGFAGVRAEHQRGLLKGAVEVELEDDTGLRRIALPGGLSEGSSGSPALAPLRVAGSGRSAENWFALGLAYLGGEGAPATVLASVRAIHELLGERGLFPAFLVRAQSLVQMLRAAAPASGPPPATAPANIEIRIRNRIE